MAPGMNLQMRPERGPGARGRLWKVIQIGQILVSAGRLLVRLQVCQGYEGELEFADSDELTPLEAVNELNPLDRSEDIDPERRFSHSNYLLRSQEQGWLEVRSAESKFPDGLDDAVRVLGADCHPDIQVGSGARITMQADGVPADQKVLNSVRVE